MMIDQHGALALIVFSWCVYGYALWIEAIRTPSWRDIRVRQFRPASTIIGGLLTVCICMVIGPALRWYGNWKDRRHERHARA